MHKGFAYAVFVIACFICPVNAATNNTTDLAKQPLLKGIQTALRSTDGPVSLRSLIGRTPDRVCILFAPDDSMSGGSITALLKAKGVRNVPLITRLGLLGRDESYSVAFIFTRQEEFVDLVRASKRYLTVAGEPYYWEVDLSGDYCKKPDELHFEKRRGERSNYISIRQ